MVANDMQSRLAMNDMAKNMAIQENNRLFEQSPSNAKLNEQQKL